MTEDTNTKKVRLRDLKKLYTEDELNYDWKCFTRAKANDLKKIYGGCNYYNVTSKFDDARMFAGEYKYKAITKPEDIEVILQVIWLGGFKITADKFEPMECPICHKKELYPTYVGASALSGLRKLQTVCLSCHEEIQYFNEDYWRNQIKPVLLKTEKDKEVTKTIHYS